MVCLVDEHTQQWWIAVAWQHLVSFKYSLIYSLVIAYWDENFIYFYVLTLRKYLKQSNSGDHPSDGFSFKDTFTWKTEEFSFYVQQIPMTKWKQNPISLLHNFACILSAKRKFI